MASQRDATDGEQNMQVPKVEVPKVEETTEPPALSTNPSVLQSSDAIDAEGTTRQSIDGLALTSLPPSSRNLEPSKLGEDINRELYQIPSYAGWFVWGRIHAIERRALNDFFDGRCVSKTPKIYKEYRNFIINKYRENPQTALKYTEVRKMLVGDVNLIRKVFDFLEYWGLINYHAPPENKQQQAATTTDSTHTVPSENVPPGVQIVYPGSKMATGSRRMNLISHRDVFGKRAGEPQKEAVDEVPGTAKHKCSKCSAECTEKAFQNMKKESLTLCSKCFASMDSTTGFSKDDFKIKELAVDSQTKPEAWTRKEVLLLLEGVSKYGDDWHCVANHVKTKSKVECILHFIRLPFGDQFVSDGGSSPPQHVSTCNLSAVDSSETPEKMQNGGPIHEADVGFKESARISVNNENIDPMEDMMLPPLKRRHLSPFSDASNPMLAQVAFLSAMVGPRVAAASAQAAVAALAEEDPVESQILFTKHHHTVQAAQIEPSPSIGQTTSKETVKAEQLEKEDAPSSGQVGEEPTSMLKDDNNSDPSIAQIQAAVATSIAAAAVNAKLLADQEEREIEQLMSSIIESEFKKLVSKVDHFEEMEFLLEREQLQVEKARTQVIADWMRYSQDHYNGGHG